MENVLQEIQQQYSIDRKAALRLFDQIFECYANPDNSLLAIEQAEISLPLDPGEKFRRKWIALFPTIVVIVGESHSGTRVLLRISELVKARLS